MVIRAIIAAGAALTSGTSCYPELSRPTNLSNGVQQAETLLELIGYCIESHPRWGLENELRRQEKRSWRTADRDEGVWGSESSVVESIDTPSGAKCRKSIVSESLKKIDKALDIHDVAFANATHGIEHGVWMGSIKLCQGSVVETKLGADKIDNYPELLIKLTPQARASVALLTRRSIGRRLAFRLDGVIIARPTTYDPIEHGNFSLTGPDEAILKRASLRMRESAC